MEKVDRRRRGVGAAGALILLALIVEGCARSGGPAPLVSNLAPPPPTQIIVQRGQTLSGIAHAYHVPMPVVAEANHLGPPYRILVGQALIIPAAGAPNPYGPTMAMAEPMSPSAAAPPPAFAPSPIVAPLPRPPPVSMHAIPLDHPPPASLAKPPAAAAPPIALTPPSSAISEPIPPTPSTSPAAAPPPSERFSSRSAPPTPSASPGSAIAAEPPPAAAHGSGNFVWPVRGRVLEGFGTGTDGTHNDGINIAAPRGAAIEATDAGVVAYSGNELRGYGNLILIKHPNGWISAYAHCDLILVKTGQRVARGQVIARVGTTGNVSEPQLHFELRRGKKPVDPREYLAPLSTAAVKEGHPG